MKRKGSVVLLVLLVAIAGCGGTNPPAMLQCEANEDCTSGCEGYDHAVCSTDGMCYCGDAIPTARCDLDEDCADICANYDSFSCSGGICYCMDEAPNDCPPITRGELVELLYDFGRYDQCPSELSASCTDVPEGTEQSCKWAVLQESGIFDIVDECRPNDYLIRVEFIKIIITMIDGLADYQAPIEPTFDDTPMDIWYYNYVEAAVQLGLIKPADDGLFHPADTVTTCFAHEVLWRASLVRQQGVQNHVASVQDIHPGGIAIAGSTEVLSARYRVWETSQANPITSLTVINDLSGAFDAPESTVAVEQVWVSCAPPSGVGNHIFYSGVLVNGEVTISGMDCYDETGNGLEVQLAFDVSRMAAVGESLSGQQFRLGIREDTLDVSGQEAINTFVVRKSRPYPQKASGLPTTLVNGENTLYGVEICADPAGSVSFARLQFVTSGNVDITGGGKGCSNYRLYRNASLVQSAEINTFSPFEETVSMAAIMTQEEVIAAGACNTYYLKAECFGFSVVDRLTTRVHPEYAEVPDPNTGCIYDDEQGVCLTGGSPLAFFSASVFTYSLIWSDRSADLHEYPMISGDQFLSRGSYDWTNGWGLGLEQLPAHTLTY